ncbi:COG1470 family protein [Streptomyces capparidis]
MSVTASLDASSVTVEPGSETGVALTVLNPGDTVEEYRFEVVGACAGWAAVEPRSVSLYPGESATAAVRLRPPRTSEVPAGQVPFGVRVIPTSDPTGTVVPEGVVTVLPFTEITPELVPRGSHGAWGGRHRLAVDNRGNAAITVHLTPGTDSERARVTVSPEQLTIPPGRAEFAAVRVRPTERIWRGTALTHPFRIAVTPEAGDVPPVVLDGSYEQEPLLPRWLPRALLATVLVAVALVGLWYALLRPAVRSEAREAITPERVEKALEEGRATPDGSAGTAGAAAGAGPDGAAGPPEQAGAPSPSAPGAASGGSAGANGSGGGGGAGPAGDPTSARVETKDAVGGETSTDTAYRVPDGKTFALTDIVVQNPQGDAGTVVVSNGDAPVLRLALENFRDSDYHFVTPILVPEGGTVTMTVDCRQVGRPVRAPAPSQCAESLFIGGTLRDMGST